MKNRFVLKTHTLLTFAFLSLLHFYTFPQTHNSTQSHQSEVSSLAFLEKDKAVFSSGKDGFLIKWGQDGIGEHYQVSDLPVRMISRSPNGDEIAVYESDGASLHRVSIWNWKTLTRRSAFRFSDSITSLSYSAKGTYVICGTTSLNGTYFINSATQNIERNKLREGTGVVTYIYTSGTENSMLLYAPLGTITYYNLKTGEKKQKFSTEFDLKQVGLFNNGVFLAGVRDNKSIHIIQAVTGKTVASFQANNPILVSSTKSDRLFYITNENRQFKLYQIQNDRNKEVIAPELIRTFSGLKQNEKIICAEYADDLIYAGTSLGNIYSFDYAASERVDTQLPLSDNMYEKIYDIASRENDVYFLTETSLYQSSYERATPDRKFTNKGFTNLISMGDKVILWSKDTRRTVSLLEVSTGKLSNLFTPQGNIQSLRLYNDNSLISIESNSTVNLYSISTGEQKQLYKGTSIQDAILHSDTDLYVAKSKESNPAVPLVYVNTRTQEVVPLSLKGNIAYSLNFDDDSQNSNELYGVLISTDSSSKKLTTSVFAYDISKKLSRTCLSINDEDNNAFTYLSSKILYTNIGKSSVRSYNLISKRDFVYKRSASMPIKIVKNGGRLASLNRDGSISWYNSELNNIIANWYLKNDGSWYEF